MPVYEPKDYDKVIKRIQEKIDTLHIKMGKCLSEEAITAFEDCHKIQLPQAYRIFLKKVGNGCDHMFEGCCLNGLENSPCQSLSEPFQLEKYWIWEDDDREPDIIASEQEHKVYRGNIELINLGCCMSYNLIVTGKCRGEVWNFTDVGVQPCCERQDFLGWFELWLDNQDETDYFKDYIEDNPSFTLRNQETELHDINDADIEDYLDDMFSQPGYQFVVLYAPAIQNNIRFVQATVHKNGELEVELGIEGDGPQLLYKICSEKECCQIFLDFYENNFNPDLGEYKPVEFMQY